ncbi:iron complex transport system substrate-binding protein [Neisseria sp. HSC-16F19]|nr:siderophore ABC transporter substrate-binding protein [Neisseria sp. HSC-16F19]MCP2040236.1 iron complex transport system substrate-binding protein [Neisseria sp. HSC-16F19]
MLKSTVYTLTTLSAALLLAACNPQQSSSDASAPAPAGQTAAAGDTLTVATARGEASVPRNPERVAVFDWGMLDTLTKLGVDVGAVTDESDLSYLKPAFAGKTHVGTLFEPNYEALHAFQPQLIITGSRTAKAYDKLSELAPTIEMTVDTANMLANAKERITTFGEIFGKQAEAAALNQEIDQSFADAKAAAAGQGKGLVVLVNGNKLAAFGPSSRLGGWIHKDIGVAEVDADIKEGSHGQPISFEYIKEKNPDWLFVLDRGAAIGEEGAAAQDVLNNPLIAETTAWKKGQVVYLLPETYLAAGGAQELLNASKQLTDAFKAAQ